MLNASAKLELKVQFIFKNQFEFRRQILISSRHLSRFNTSDSINLLLTHTMTKSYKLVYAIGQLVLNL